MEKYLYYYINKITHKEFVVNVIFLIERQQVLLEVVAHLDIIDWLFVGGPHVPELDRQVVPCGDVVRVVAEELAGGERIDQIRECVFLLPEPHFKFKRRIRLEGGGLSEVAHVHEALAGGVQEDMRKLRVELAVSHHLVKLVHRLRLDVQHVINTPVVFNVPYVNTQIVR